MTFQSMLNIVKSLEAVFHHRSTSHHFCAEPVKIFSNDNQQTVLVLDPRISKKILTSQSFISFNYFKGGVDQLMAKGLPVTWLNDFYQENILFKEGAEHQIIKKSFTFILDELTSEINRIKPRIKHFFEKRKATINSPLLFATLYTRIFSGYLIAYLTQIPLKKVYRGLRLRQNVFGTYFQSSKHLAMAAVFSTLYENSRPPPKEAPHWFNHLFAHHFFMMGIDPLIGSICANIVENSSSYVEDVYRYCPLSFVERKCIRAVRIDDMLFNPDDICYVSLLKGPDQDNGQCPVKRKPKNLPFGLGNHTCIGKHLALLLLETAENIVGEVFPHGFQNQSIIAHGGAFLSFKDA